MSSSAPRTTPNSKSKGARGGENASCPGCSDTAPTHFPYDTTQEPRRLDYVGISGSSPCTEKWGRSELRQRPPKPPTTKPPCGPRHAYIAYISDQRLITKPGRADRAKFVESRELKQARREAHATAPGQARRQAWKEVHKQLKREHKQWQQNLAAKASQHDWPSYRQHKRGKGGEAWIAALTDSHDWQGDGATRDADFQARRQRIRRFCKTTPWQPFSEGELAGVATRWKSNKCTGPDQHGGPTPLHHRGAMGRQWVQPALTVLGSPVSFQGGPPQLAAEMGARARAAWGKNKDLLTAKTALKRRLQLHNVLVRQSALWAAETWPVQSTLLKAANAQQLQQVRCMIGGGRAPGEAWADWNTRTLRMARVHLQQNKVERWALVHTHTYYGPFVGYGGTSLERGTSRMRCSCGGGCSGGDNSSKLPPEQGARHAARFNSSLDTERHITAIAGERGGERARDRLQWESLAEKFLEAYDPPWCSGKQAQLENLAHTCSDARAARAIENPGRKRTAGHRFSS